MSLTVKVVLLTVIICPTLVAQPKKKKKSPETRSMVLPDEGTKDASESAMGTDTVSSRKGRLGIGAGFWNLLLPEASLQASYYITNQISAGAFFTYFVVPLSQVSAQSQSFGLMGRYRTGNMFFGGSYAQRTIYLNSKSEVGVDGQNTEVAWLSRTTQTVITPEGGWVVAEKGQSSVTIGLGWQLLMGSKFDIVSDPTGVSGVSEEDFAAEKSKKGDDMQKISQGQYPHIEITYVRWMNLGKRRK